MGGIAALAALSPANQAKLVQVAQITEQFPAFAPLLQIPEVAALLINAAKPGSQINSTKLLTEIQNTNWWKTNSVSSRQWTVTKLVDPAEAAQQQGQVATQILQQAGQAGIVLTPSQVALLAQDAAQHSWTSAQLQHNIGAQAEYGQLRPGTMQNTAMQLQGTAASYGVPLSTQSAFSWAQRINEGTATADGFNAYAVQQAKLHFPTLAEHLDQGMTVRQLADPYLQVASQTLGIDPNAVEMSDPKWAAALQSRDAKGNIVGPMTTLDWQRKIMEDPVYGYDHTANAQSAATNLVQQLGTAFGVTKS